MAARLTKRFTMLVDDETYRRMHEAAGRGMISVGELVRRYLAEGLERDEPQV